MLALLRQRLVSKGGHIAKVATAQLHYTAGLHADSNDRVVTPWYVQEAEKMAEAAPRETEMFPDLPSNAPGTLEKVVSFAISDLGLRDVVVLDKRNEIEGISAIGPSLLIIGTGTGQKHLGSAGQKLLTWLKKDHNVYAGREGVLTTNFLRLHNRRQRRRQQRQRMTSDSSESLQRVGSWIAVDTKLDNIYVHMMTSDRRAEVDLENLTPYFEENFDVSDSNLADMESEYVEPASPTYKPRSALGRRNFSSSTGAHQGSLPETREELALRNLILESHDDINEDSAVVHDFVQQFPKIPTKEDWKNRLEFFAIIATRSSSFNLQRLVDEAATQQSSGFVLDESDVEMVVSAICYHGQHLFASQHRDAVSLGSWEQMSDFKAKILSDFYDNVLRPAGNSLVLNPRLLVLMYRSFVGMSLDSTTPAAASRQPTPSSASPLDMFFDRKRLTPLRYLIERTDEMQNLHTVAMILTSLINGHSYDAFWKIADAASLTSPTNREYSEQLTELVLSLAIRSGDKQHITFAIQTYLTASILQRKVSLTADLVRIVESGLTLVEETGSFTGVRAVLARYHDSLPESRDSAAQLD